ncbi:olfactory receptor 52E8-like [Acipenser ruthenus]|uniref:olfactory receptor 52E8-like n=1 Tax=Acipenser ruthenus TaxID=7906 RepID=UPI00274151DC|nr:olfactory receptor 52E8-like [Acipenser ruthenus]XP_058887023.1 olfactory receptor 52E8-like [Acipenser ruthenus]
MLPPAASPEDLSERYFQEAMQKKNSSYVTMFTLSGLNESITNKYIYFSFTLLGYLFIMFVNLTLIIIIALEKTLHEPMYFFLCNLSANALYGTAGFYPKLLFDFLSDTHVISYSGCLLQIFVIYSFSTCELSNLTVMACDRYVAICRPLEYHTIMSPLTTSKLILFSWIFSFSCLCFAILLTISLPLCGSHIDKLYCDNWSIVKLSCVGTTVNNGYGYVIICIFFAHFLFILFSYMKILSVCRASSIAMSKCLQTCLPHLLMVINYFIAVFFDIMYSKYGSSDIPQVLHYLLSLEFLIVPPVFSPIIYGLNLKKIREKFTRICSRNKVIHA